MKINNIIQAIFYGKDVACFAQQIVRINQEFYEAYVAQIEAAESSDETRNLRYLFDKQSEVTDDDIEGEIQIVAESFQSGESLTNIIFALIDKYGQIIGSDSSRYSISPN